MKVIEHIAKSSEPLVSFEIIPPKRGGDIKSLLRVVDDIAKFKPPFIDITSHAAEVIYEETPQGIQRKIKRKRPGTLGICALIQNKYNIDAVPHVLCQGFTREETEDFLIELQYLEIDNILALRGDTGRRKPVSGSRTVNRYADDLVQQISNMNKGQYLEDNLLDARPSNFCVGVSAYPEKHFEAPNLDFDIQYLKKKIEAGAEYVVTQMFFDNKCYFDFVEKCQAQGITVPIIPGLKIISSKSQLVSVPKNFYVDIPAELTNEILEAKEEQVLEIGVNWTNKQFSELLAHNVPAVHFYILQDSKPINLLMQMAGR